MFICQFSSLGEICEAMNEDLSPSNRTWNIGHLWGEKYNDRFSHQVREKGLLFYNEVIKENFQTLTKLCFFFIAYWKDKESLDKKTTDLLAEKVRFLLEIKPFAFNQFMKMDTSLSIITTMQMLDFRGVPYCWSARDVTAAMLVVKNQSISLP